MREVRRFDKGSTGNNPGQPNDSIAEATMTAALQRAAFKVRHPGSVLVVRARDGPNGTDA